MEVKEAKWHFHHLMKGLDDLRKDEVFYDVRMVFGDREILAHKCILIASSDYFKSLFLGPIKTKDDKVDLSSVALDFASVKAVIDFLYTGKIKIDDENLGAVIKLSTFLLVKNIQFICEAYMRESKTLESCLTYYFLAEEYMLDKNTRSYLAATMHSRFHDCLIFEESTREISPDQLKHLMQKFDIFERVCTQDIVSFVIDWVLLGETKDHILIGTEILSVVDERPDVNFAQCEVRKKIGDLRDKSGTNDTYSTFLGKLDVIVENNLIASVADLYVDSETASATKVEELGSLENDSDQIETEQVLIVFASKECLKEFLTSSVPMKTYDEESEIFDVCVYVPEQKSWYYLAEGPNESVFRSMGARNYDISGTWFMYPHPIKENFHSGWLSNCCTLDKICCVAPNKSVVCMYDLQEHIWEAVSYKHLLDFNSRCLDRTEDVKVICKDGSQLYLILRQRIPRGWSDKIYFKCYKLGPHQSWSLMFETRMLEWTEDNDLEGGKFAVCLSQDGKEMSIFNQGLSMQMVIANLTFQDVEMEELDLPYNNYDKLPPDHVWLLREEGREVAIEEFSDEEDNILYRTRMAKNLFGPDPYMFDSYRETYMDMSYVDEDGYSNNTNMFACVSDSKSLWVVSGDGKFVSSLDQMVVDPNGHVKQVHHTPPPFSAVSAVAEGRIRKEHLALMKPIKRFLHE